MSSDYISSYVLSSTLRSTVMGSQVALSKATTEATTGRLANIGLGLGPLTGHDVVLRVSQANVKKIIDTNALVTGRLDTTQQRLTDVIQTAKDFLQQLIGARGTPDGGKVLVTPAKANLQDLISTLNTAMEGQYIFGGINTQVQPVNDYYQPGAPNKTSLDAAFFGAFGFAQTATASVAGTSVATVQGFLAAGGPLDQEFANPGPVPPAPGWNNNWSTASNTVLQSRVSTTQIIDSSVSANEPGFRKLAEAYTLMGDCSVDNMNQPAFQAAVDKAAGLVAGAISDLALVQGRVGTYQNVIATSNEKLNMQSDLLTIQVNDMEKVDPTEASVRITTLQNQIQTAMSLTAQLQKLSLVNFL